MELGVVCRVYGVTAIDALSLEIVMKLIRFGPQGFERPGVLLDGQRLDCSELFLDWNHDFFSRGGLSSLAQMVSDRRRELPVVEEDQRWGACIARPGKIVCIGLNYKDHAEEAGMPIPSEPVVFLKAPNAMSGPYDNIVLPRGSTKADWEVELGIVVGREARYLSDSAAGAACIAGYCVLNDVSERAFQIEHEGQWTKGKSCDTFCPVGPWLVTPEELSNVANLRMTLAVNSVVKQDSNTEQMIFSPGEVVRYLSQFMTLEEGDLLATGTPPGVGMGQRPEQYLTAGDGMELSIEGLGTQRYQCESAL